MRRLLIFFLATVWILSCVGAPAARQSQSKPAFFPIIPIIADFEYAPEYFIQWMKDDPRYSMIQAVLYQREPPVCMIILTENKGGREVYYSNSEQKVKALKLSGRTAHLARIDFRVVERVGQQPAFGFGFADENRQAVRWRFIPTSAATARGAGVGAAHYGQGLQWICRNLGTAAGEGSAVEVGDRVSEAEPWPEISAPPYFIAYRGFYQLGLTRGGMSPGSEAWQTTSSPDGLGEGAAWVLTDLNKNERRMKITSHKGDEITIADVSAQRPYAATVSLEAHASAEGFGLRSVTAAYEGHKMRIRFKPELPLGKDSPALNRSEGSFQIDQDDRQAVVEGVISAERQGNNLLLRWHPKSPDWAKSQDLTTIITLEPTGYKLVAK